MLHEGGWTCIRCTAVGELHRRFLFVDDEIVSDHGRNSSNPTWDQNVKITDAMLDENEINMGANMIHMLDVAVGNVTAALQQYGMWEDTVSERTESGVVCSASLRLIHR